MIGKLQGIVDYIGDGFIILTVSGVGYKVYTPETLTSKAPATLWIETVVREDSIRLFGFSTLAGQNLFNMLTGVSGVGPKVAMAIMGTIKTDTLMTAIATGDAKTIATAPGVGKKVAEKIIVELKSRLAARQLHLIRLAIRAPCPICLRHWKHWDIGAWTLLKWRKNWLHKTRRQMYQNSSQWH